MNNNSIKINSYLQNEMSADERSVFEQQLATDKALREELFIQQQIIAAAVHSGIKSEFSKAIRHKIWVKRLIAITVIVVVCTVTILFYKGTFLNKTTSIATLSTTVSFINPPLPAANVPFTAYSLDAEKGDTIFHQSGSIICFPQSSFVDANGNLVKGKVNITYREFATPLDFFVSGIPMDYDSAGRKYNFESSGMCEINAYQNDIAVFVNPNSKPVIYLSGSNKSDLHNLYSLDTVNHRWNYIGKDTITAIKDLYMADSSKTSPVSPEEGLDYPAKPLKPIKASDDRPSFSIEIDPGSFEELFAYDKLKMEVLDESNYKRSDADEHWNSVKLERTDATGIYMIVFTNLKRSVTYKVRPVLEGADYDAALKVFNEKEKTYQQSLKSRIAREKQEEEKIILQNKAIKEETEAIIAENNRRNALRAMIIERNKLMEEIYKDEVAKAEKQRLRLEQLEKERVKYITGFELSNEIIRTFSINNFGIWNCDHPQYPDLEIPVYSRYMDEKGKNINLQQVAVVYKDFNGITRFRPDQIRVIPGKDNMLWSIVHSSFLYFSYEDFKKANIQKGTSQFIFQMRKSGKRISSYNEIKELVEGL